MNSLPAKPEGSRRAWAVSRKHFALNGSLADRVLSLAPFLAARSAMPRVRGSGESATSSFAGLLATSIHPSQGCSSRCAAPLPSYNRQMWH